VGLVGAVAGVVVRVDVGEPEGRSAVAARAVERLVTEELVRGDGEDALHRADGRNRELEMEVTFLKKAAAYFAKDPR
jgi:hypothetical protein